MPSDILRAPLGGLIVAALAVAGCRRTIADPRPVEIANPFVVEKSASISYYNIEGHTERDLREEIITLGPRSTGRAGVGEYQSKLNMRVSTRAVNGECEPTVRIEVTSTIVLPRWINSTEADTTLRQWWKGYFETVVDHEEWHRHIALGAADSIQRTLVPMRAPTCARLTTDIKQRYDGLYRGYLRQQFAFDSTEVANKRRPPSAPVRR